jgi:hypothetical protein
MAGESRSCFFPLAVRPADPLKLTSLILARTRRKDTAAAGSYTFVITVTSFFLWYRPIYLGYKKEGGLALFFCKSHLN